MYTMKDGRPYTSKWCFNHAQYVNNFKGIKLKPFSSSQFTDEFKEYMKPFELEVKITGDLKKKYAVCPKCHLQIELQK